MSAPDHDHRPDDAWRVRRFTVLAQAEPGLLPRLIEPVAKRGLIPRRFEAIADEATLRVSLSIELDGKTASLLRASLRAVVGVATVLSEPA
ncbi:hypothetical protein [Elioraea sp.]|jgi:hypothetical protein|uniref:hypothetical protein n=1 Tax=Elioraea sp. TaxID=2185103 RepID=UPI003F7133D0